MANQRLARHGLTRRSFLGATGAALGASALGLRILTDNRVLAEADEQTTEDSVFCVAHMSHCEGHCALKTTVRDGRLALIEPNNWNNELKETCCLKGISEVQHVYSPERLQTPLRRVGERGEGKFEAISWDEALDEIAENIKATNEKYGLGSVLMLSTGEAGETSMGSWGCLRTLVGGQDMIAGIDMGMMNGIFPGIAFAFGASISEINWADAELVVIWGANTLESQLHSNYQFADALQAGTRFVVIDPQFTRTATKADTWIPIRPGYDTPFMLGMINHVLQNDLVDTDYIVAHTDLPFLIDAKTGTRYELGVDPTSRMATEDDPEQYIDEEVEADAAEKLNEEIDEVPRYAVWDKVTNSVQPFDAPGIVPDLNKRITLDGIEYVTAFVALKDAMEPYTVDWASKETDVEADTIAQLAEDLAAARTKGIFFGYGGQDKLSNSDVLGHAGLVLAGLLGMIGGTEGNGYGMVDSTYNLSFWMNEWEVESDLEVPETDPLHADPRDPENNIHAFITAGDTFNMQLADFNRTKEWAKDLDFIAIADVYHTTGVDWADIVLPVCSKFECEEELIGVRGQCRRVILSERAIEPLFDSHTDFWIVRELFDRFGAAEQFPSSIREYIEYRLETCEQPGVSDITIEDLQENHGVIVISEDPTFSMQVPDYELPTPSGRIETFFPEYFDEGQGFPAPQDPIEVYTDNPLRDKYPLNFIQVRTQYHIHNQFCDASWLSEFMTAHLELNPVDAEARGLAEGDVVRVFNDRGTLEIPLVVSEAVRPGIARTFEGWWSDDFIEGNFQDLTNATRTTRGIPLLLGPVVPFFDTLVEVEKA